MMRNPGLMHPGKWVQVGAPTEEDLMNWGQHTGPSTVADEVMQRVGAELPGTISFVFSCQVANAEHIHQSQTLAWARGCAWRLSVPAKERL